MTPGYVAVPFEVGGCEPAVGGMPGAIPPAASEAADRSGSSSPRGGKKIPGIVPGAIAVNGMAAAAPAGAVPTAGVALPEPSASACVRILAKGAVAGAAPGDCVGTPKQANGSPGVAVGSAERQLGERVIEINPSVGGVARAFLGAGEMIGWRRLARG